MSKLSFRSRALDAAKPMPIYYVDDAPEFQDFTLINRTVPKMPTGMEKEEESEHHLQRAISAQQAYGHTGELVIPTPEVYNVPRHHKQELYPDTYKSSRQLIHVQPFSMDQDIPDYDMDSEDERWLSQQALDIKPLQYEEMMDRLEKSSGQQVVTLKEAKLLLKDDDDIIIAVYDYWLNKRLKTQHSLIPQVKTEKRDGSTNNNPYVAFRRRTEKMQTRKNRKNDEASYEKMLKLRRDLMRAVTLLEMVKRREKTKREILHLTVEIIEKRYQAGDFSGQMMAEVSAIKHPRQNFVPLAASQQFVIKPEVRIPKSKPPKGAPTKKRQYKRRRTEGGLAKIGGHDLGDSLSSEEEGASLGQSDAVDDDGVYTFRRKKNCSYHEPRLDSVGSWPWCSSREGGYEDRRFRFCPTAVPLPPEDHPRNVGFARRRIGRGGRVVFDRIWSRMDDRLSEFDEAVTRPDFLSPDDPLNEMLGGCTFFRPRGCVSQRDCGDVTRGSSSLNREDDLFELQRKQLERLKAPVIPSPQVLLATDFSTYPSSLFHVSNPHNPPHHYHLVSVEMAPPQGGPAPSEEPHHDVPCVTTVAVATTTTPNVERIVALTNGPVAESGEELRRSELLRRIASTVPSIEMGRNEETLHVIHHPRIIHTTAEHNGTGDRLKTELFLSKVKVEKVTTDSSVSMDIT